MTMQEVELKFLDINKEEIEQKLHAIGAKKVRAAQTRSTYLGREKNYSYTEGDPVLRIREYDALVSVTHKSRSKIGTVRVAEETEIQVHSTYEETITLFIALGYHIIKEFYKYRTHYEKQDVSYEIDEQEGIPTLLEIETRSEEEMRTACAELGLRMEEGTAEHLGILYPRIFR